MEDNKPHVFTLLNVRLHLIACRREVCRQDIYQRGNILGCALALIGPDWKYGDHVGLALLSLYKM